MDAGRLWSAEQYLAFVNEVLPISDPSLENALAVSFIEDFALGEINEHRLRAISERAPEPLRTKVIAINPDWRS